MQHICGQRLGGGRTIQKLCGCHIWKPPMMMMPAWIAQLSSVQRPDHKKGSDWSEERRKNPISLSKEEREREREREGGKRVRREREIEDRELSSRRNVKEIMRRKRLRHQFRRLLSRLMYCRGWANRIRIQVSASQLYFLVSCSQRDDIH